MVEFYSGIGGMVSSFFFSGIVGNCCHNLGLLEVVDHLCFYCVDQRYSLMESGVRFEIVEAFDINDKANDVYEFNFGHRPCQVLLLLLLFNIAFLRFPNLLELDYIQEPRRNKI